MTSVSTGVRNALLPYLREMFNRGIASLKLYAGAIPTPTAAQTAAGVAASDLAVTGTLLCTVTASGASVKAKQKIRFTPVIGTATAGDWTITLNGVTFKFTGDGSVTIAEVCTGLYNLIRAGQRTTAITTPAGAITIPDIDGLFTLTDNATSLDIEAATAGISFDYSSAVSGSGAGTATFASSIVTADAYGLQFEAIADIATGILEKLATQEWKGTNAASGAATHWRLVLDGDTGALTSTEKRLQGLINTANSDINRTSGTQFTADEFEYITTFPITLPASA